MARRAAAIKDKARRATPRAAVRKGPTPVRAKTRGPKTPGRKIPGTKTSGARVPRAKAAARSARRPPRLERIGGAPEIMVALNNEHRYIASLLEALAEQADKLLPGRTPDYAMMLDIARYMSEYPDEFHHPREDLLFGHLVQRDPESRELVGQLLEGHKEIGRRSRELFGALQRAVRGDERVDNRRLKYLCDRYIGFYWDHINTEEGKLFPRATAKLRQDDWYAVNSKAKYVDDPLFGTRVRKEYQRLSQYLSTRVERVTEDIAVAELFGIEALIEAVATLGEALGEIRGIVGRRVRASARDSIGVSNKRLRQRDWRAVAGLPAALFGSAREHAGGAAREIGAVLTRSRGELREPFSARLAYLRKMID